MDTELFRGGLIAQFYELEKQLEQLIIIFIFEQSMRIHNCKKKKCFLIVAENLNNYIYFLLSFHSWRTEINCV